MRRPGPAGEIGDEEAVPHLSNCWTIKDHEVQDAAIMSLGKIGGTEAKRHLQKTQQITRYPDQRCGKSRINRALSLRRSTIFEFLNRQPVLTGKKVRLRPRKLEDAANEYRWRTR